MKGTLGRISLHFGKSRTYLDTVRIQTPEKYDFIMSFDEIKTKSVRKYCEFVEQLINRLQQEALNQRLSKDILEQAGYKSKNMSASRWSLEQHLFMVRDDFLNVKYNVLKRYMKLAELLNNGDIK